MFGWSRVSAPWLTSVSSNSQLPNPSAVLDTRVFHTQHVTHKVYYRISYQFSDVMFRWQSEGKLKTWISPFGVRLAVLEEPDVLMELEDFMATTNDYVEEQLSYSEPHPRNDMPDLDIDDLFEKDRSEEEEDARAAKAAEDALLDDLIQRASVLDLAALVQQGINNGLINRAANPYAFTK